MISIKKRRHINGRVAFLERVPIHLNRYSLLSDMLEQNPGEEGADTTLTVEALSGSQTAEESSFDLAGLGISTINKTMKPDTSKANFFN